MTKIIITATPWDTKSLYQESTSPALRALLGYMVKTGNTNDVILGGAFSLIRAIEMCNGKLYRLVSSLPKEQANEIVMVAEGAMAGNLKGFAFTQREIKKILKHISAF